MAIHSAEHFNIIEILTKPDHLLNYTNISTSGNKMVISLKIIFYDNTTTDEKIIVDIDLGEIIE